MDAQRKVTTFVTRGSGATAELLVFWHPGSGTQVPGGTVEDGEAFEAAARREVTEETGLSDLELVDDLGVRRDDLPEGRAVVVRRIFLQTRPGPDGPQTSWSFTNIGVEVVERRDGYARVVYEERDLDAGNDGLLYARFHGWVPDDALAYRQVRAFYHFRAGTGAPERWQQLENDKFVFHLFWVPLVPKPDILIGPIQEWLDTYHDALTSVVDAQGGEST
ncbi:MAG TPA: NUDIX domain-containing protein [Actinopolymorphaceae bacterium]|nr:NUDIX domain-containing protein [Actinopolymorphaceae bacterium]